MSPWLLATTVLLVFAAAAVATGVVTRWLRRRAILDRPNRRSSHSVPTPRGGGLGVLAAVLPAWMLLAALVPEAMPEAPLWSVLVGTLLLLDEPLEGLAPIIVEELVRGLRKMITEEGTAVILVEQHAEIALSLTAQAVLLERGAIVHRARSQDLLKDHATLDRYIGLRVAEGGA